MTSAEHLTEAGDEPDFAPIRQRFIETIDDRIAQFEAMKAHLPDQPSASEALFAIAAEAHKIAGVAETLGFFAVGRAALDTEAAIAPFQARRTTAADAWRVAEPHVETLLDALETLVETG